MLTVFLPKLLGLFYPTLTQFAPRAAANEARRGTRQKYILLSLDEIYTSLYVSKLGTSVFDQL